jgi:hypothetical protein
MSDNTKVKASKAEKAQKKSDKSAAKMLSDVTISLDQIQHPGVKTQKVSETGKTGAHKAVSDVKTSAPKTGSKSKKK